jgi:hypothetical protein
MSKGNDVLPWNSVVGVTESTHGLTNPRRGIVFPVPGLQPADYFAIKTRLFEAFGLSEYSQVVSAEARWRQSPHLAPVGDKLDRVRRVYSQRAPALFSRIKAGLSPRRQLLSKDSRLGWPDFSRPGDKRPVVEQRWNEWVSDRSSFDNMFTIMNVRIQAEEASKVREYQVPEDGVVVNKKMGEPEKRLSETTVASRARLVFNKPELNLSCQIVDTYINAWLGKQGACHHDMYGMLWRNMVRPHRMAFDVKHMERFTAGIMEPRYDIIKGLYSEAHRSMDEAAYLTPNYMFRGWSLLRGCPSDWVVQFGSGHSAVAPSQKEALLCLYVQLHMDEWGYSEDRAWEEVLSGNTAKLHIMNFGDDNFISAYDEETLSQTFQFMSKYLDCVEENPAGFLGFKWIDDGFKLPKESYLIKTYLHERPPYGRFRSYPFFGWFMKREIFSRYGVSRDMEAVFELEDRLLLEEGQLRWSDVEKAARNEIRAMKGLIDHAHPLAILGKEYLLTDEEKEAIGTYTGWDEDFTAKRFAELTQGGIFEGANFGT